MASIKVNGVSKSFADTAVLRNVDIEAAEGEFLVLVGPSGCGKSTLLRMIAGLETPDQGEVYIGDIEVTHLPPKDRDVAMVFQSYALYPHMTVRENMSFSLRLKGMSRARVVERVNAAAARLGLEDLLDRKPRALSGGQRQRVAMGRAMVREPKAFLFDEPLSNLDARLREQMRYEIRKLQRDLGVTSVYVTHDQIEAMTMADRIVVMHAGLVQQVGTPRQLYEDPANRFVAAFIGSPGMNFLEATLQDEAVGADGAPGMGIMLGHRRLGRTGMPLKMRADRRVVVGIRPERIVLADPSFGLTAQLDMVETTGLGLILHLTLASQSLKVFTTDRLQLVAKQSLGIVMQPADLRLFDPDSGARLQFS